MLLLFVLTCLCFIGNINAQVVNVSEANEIQNAINELANTGGGTVQLNAGVYVIDTSIQMKSNVTLQGVGVETRIELPLDATYPMIIDDGTEPLNNITIRNLLLDGNIPESKVSHDPNYTSDPQNPCLGIYFDAYRKETYHTNIIIENVEIHNTVDGCHLKGVRGGYMDNVYMHHNGIFFWPGHNSYLRRCIDYTVKNSRFDYSYNGSGVNCSFSENLLFSNCVVIGSQGRGIRNAASQGFVVHDCKIIDCGDAGIIANTEQGITTINCDFRRNCVSGCQTGIQGATSGVSYDNNSFNNGTDYALGSTIEMLQSGNTSNPGQSCSEGIGAWNPISISGVVTNENPKNIILKVSQNLEESNSYQGFSVFMDGDPMTIEGTSLLNSSQLLINLNEEIIEDKVITVSYSETGNIKTEFGKVIADINNINVINSLGAPIEVESALIDSSGKVVHLKFNKRIATIHDQANNFTFNINGEIISTFKTVVGDSTMQVYPNNINKIFFDDTITLSYQPGEYARIIATNTSELEAFNDLSVENLSKLEVPIIPGRIEAEDFVGQNSIIVEESSEGGQNIATINSGGFTEYKVLVSKDTTYKVTFRVASKYDDNTITVFVDDTIKGILEVPNTGIWQPYTSASVDVKVSDGEHEIKLLFNGQFDLNWMEFEETEPGEEGEFLDRIEAEDYDEKFGGSVETCMDLDGGEHVGSLVDGNWLMFSDLELSNTGGINMRLAHNNAGSYVEIRIDSVSGTLIGTVQIPDTGGWQKWETISSEIESVDGNHDLYMVFKNSGSWAGNFNWFQLTAGTSNVEQIGDVKNEQKIILYPNPVKEFLTIEGEINSKFEIYNINGFKVIEGHIADERHVINTLGLNPGVYIVKIQNKDTYVSGKFLKQ